MRFRGLRCFMVKVDDYIIFLDTIAEEKGTVLRVTSLTTDGYDFRTNRSEKYLAQTNSYCPLYWSFKISDENTWWRIADEYEAKWYRALNF